MNSTDEQAKERLKKVEQLVNLEWINQIVEACQKIPKDIAVVVEIHPQFNCRLAKSWISTNPSVYFYELSPSGNKTLNPIGALLYHKPIIKKCPLADAAKILQCPYAYVDGIHFGLNKNIRKDPHKFIPKDTPLNRDIFLGGALHCFALNLWLQGRSASICDCLQKARQWMLKMFVDSLNQTSSEILLPVQKTTIEVRRRIKISGYFMRTDNNRYTIIKLFRIDDVDKNATKESFLENEDVVCQIEKSIQKISRENPMKPIFCGVLLVEITGRPSEMMEFRLREQSATCSSKMDAENVTQAHNPSAENQGLVTH